jgi:Nucleotidyl transferase AbiEii toxin, Type IV TA system
MVQGQDIDRNSWQRILGSAVTIFDDLKSRKLDLPYLALGGGTVLMFRFEHRLSKDIDFFVRDVQWLGFITPRLNDKTAAMVEGYEEQANSLKLILPAGDIDFVAAGAVTTAKPTETLRFQSYSFALETTEEILAKKLFYRPESFKPRDVFDLAVAIEIDPASAAQAIAASASKHEVLTRRLRHLAQVGDAELGRDILPIGDFARFVPGMISRVSHFVEDKHSWLRLDDPLKQR